MSAIDQIRLTLYVVNTILLLLIFARFWRTRDGVWRMAMLCIIGIMTLHRLEETVILLIRVFRSALYQVALDCKTLISVVTFAGLVWLVVVLYRRKKP